MIPYYKTGIFSIFATIKVCTMHTAIPDFPVSESTMIVWAILLLACAAGFALGLLHLNRKGRRLAIGLVFALLLVAGTAIHVVLLSRSHHTVTDGNWIQLVFVSLVAAAEMFIGHTVVFDDIIAAVIFREPLLMISYITIFVLTLVFTLSMVVLIMPRRLRDRTWLRANASKGQRRKKNHVFLGVGPYSKLMAQSILKEWEKADRKNQGEIIFVEFPSAENHHAELSLGELVSNIFGRKKELSLEDELGSNRFVLLRGTLPHGGETGGLCKAIGLEKLSCWLENPMTSLYILNQQDEDNYRLLKALSEDRSIEAKIFFYTQEPDNFYSLLANTRKRLRVLNSHYMSFMQLKLEKPQVLPVHYVDLARDKDGQPLGYVEKGLKALIVGFGESGQEALRYLYEFGSFVGKDREKAPMSISIYDTNLLQAQGHFLHMAPGLKDDPALNWCFAPAGTESFWTEYDLLLEQGLRYIVVAVDKGPKNVALAIHLLQRAAQKGVDLTRFIILTRIWDCDIQTENLLAYYNAAYCPDGVQVIQPYGRMEMIWKPDVISGRSLKQTAIQFSDTFLEALGEGETWDQRSRRLNAPGGNLLSKHQELMRRQAMEIGRALYVSTLRSLSPDNVCAEAEDIPSSFNGTHFPRKGATYDVLDYLAAGEHLHWMSSLLVNGYTDGPIDELLKTHSGMVSYNALSEQDRHIPWISVKTTLLLKKQ